MYFDDLDIVDLDMFYCMKKMNQAICVCFNAPSEKRGDELSDLYSMHEEWYSLKSVMFYNVNIV